MPNQIRKPTDDQQRDTELCREVRDLATSEISYRARETTKQIEDARLDLAELDARRRVLLTNTRRLERDRAVLRGVLDIRSKTCI